MAYFIKVTYLLDKIMVACIFVLIFILVITGCDSGSTITNDTLINYRNNPPAINVTSQTLLQKYQQLDANTNGGNGWAFRQDSDTLSWAESYIIQSYMVMYETYKDRSYLDKLISHVDQMIANMCDYNGDGYLGWHSSAYSARKVLNGEMDELSPTDPTFPRYWRRWQSDATTAYRSTAIEDNFTPDGQAGMVLKSDGTVTHGAEQTWSNYLNGKVYSLSFYAKTTDGINGRADIVDESNSNALLATITVNSDNWTLNSIDFTTPVTNNHSLKLKFYNNAPTATGATVIIDNVVVSCIAEYLVHDGMITYPISMFIRTVYADNSLWPLYKAGSATI